MLKSAFTFVLFVATSVALAVDPFTYDRELALELARAYVQSHLRTQPSGAVASLRYDRPEIVAGIDRSGRHLVSITFAPKAGAAGAFAVLERCRDSGLLVAVDVGVVNNLESYRAQMDHVSYKNYVGLPKVCPRSREAP